MKAEKFSINSLKDVEVHFEDLSVLIKGIMSDLDEQSGKNDALQVAIGFLIAKHRHCQRLSIISLRLR